MLLVLGAALWWSRRSAPAGDSGSASSGFGESLSSGVGSLAGLLDLGGGGGGVVDALNRAVDSAGVAVSGALWQPGAAAAPYLHLVYSAESRHGLPVNLLARLIQKESAWNPNAVNPVSGAQGLAQFMPPTAREWGVNPFDPASAIDGAARYLVWLHGQFGDWRTTLAAYNWGIGNVQRKGLAAAPPETVDYVSTIAADIGLA